MTVLRMKGEETAELACICLTDVDYMEIEGRRIVYHIGDQKYRHISTLSELEEHLSAEGFDMLDKTNLVNLNRIGAFDEQQGKVFFGTSSSPGKYATVAMIKQKLIRRERQHSGASHIRDILKRVKGNELKQRMNVDF